jgi:transcriptional regulator with XRE-family HTH domain
MPGVGVKQSASAIDKYAGARLRMRRLELGLSQEKIAEALGLSFQQLQKYEKGANRMSTGRLHQLAALLRVPPSFFFDGADAHAAPGGQFEGADLQTGFLATSYGVRLAAAFVKISDTRLQESLVSIAEQLAARPTAAE